MLTGYRLSSTISYSQVLNPWWWHHQSQIVLSPPSPSTINGETVFLAIILVSPNAIISLPWLKRFKSCRFLHSWILFRTPVCPAALVPPTQCGESSILFSSLPACIVNNHSIRHQRDKDTITEARVLHTPPGLRGGGGVWRRRAWRTTRIWWLARKT